MSLTPILYPLFAYFLGSIPSALWISRLFKGIDIREVGSGHVTTTNTIRQVGWGAGVLVLLMDLGKGFLPVFLAVQANLPDWLIALTAAAVVAGHCWPVFAWFHGGMGLATTGGSFLAVAPVAFPIGLGVLILLVLVIRHSARAALLTGLLLPLVFYLLGLRGVILVVAASAGLVIAARFTVDWNRQYRELWLDRGE